MGDERVAWFERLYDLYADAIFRHIYLRLNDRERAKELMQEVFMRTWDYVHQGKSIAHERGFLYRTAHNVVVNEYRRRRDATVSLDTLAENGFDPEDGQALAGQQAEHWELLAKLATLSDSYRTVLVLRYIDGLSVTEIADMLGESQTNISVRIGRALKSLRAAYEQLSP